MNPITTDLIFPGLNNNQDTDTNPTDNYNGTLKIFEQAIDHIVKKKLSDAKIEEQAAIEKAKKEAALKQKINFLSGALHQAEEAMSGFQVSPLAPVNPSDPKAPSPLNIKAYEANQVVYWKMQLSQASIPDSSNGLAS